MSYRRDGWMNRQTDGFSAFGKKDAKIGIAQAVQLYNAKYPDLKVSEPTARRAKHQYVDKLKRRVATFDDLDDFNELSTKKRWRPLLLG